MRLDETPRILTYVGRYPVTWELLPRCFGHNHFWFNRLV